MDDFWIILTGSLVAINCGLLGTFLILRKMAMVGDAISHSVLPGIVIAFLITGARDNIPMLIGAAMIGVLTTLLIELIHKKARLQSDAAIGITFTALFAIGVLLVSLFTKNTDLDQECVLYGDITTVPFDLWIVDGNLSLGPRPVWVMGGLLFLLGGYLAWAWKGLKLTTFDPAYAAAIGISVNFFHYSLMSAVSLTTVISFESVGAILVVAFLVVPPATAYLLTERLRPMLWLTILFGISTAAGGYYLSKALEGSIAGAMTAVAGLQFLLVFLYTWLKKSRKLSFKKMGLGGGRPKAGKLDY